MDDCSTGLGGIKIGLGQNRTAFELVQCVLVGYGVFQLGLEVLEFGCDLAFIGQVGDGDRPVVGNDGFSEEVSQHLDHCLDRRSEHGPVIYPVPRAKPFTNVGHPRGVLVAFKTQVPQDPSPGETPLIYRDRIIDDTVHPFLIEVQKHPNLVRLKRLKSRRGCNDESNPTISKAFHPNSEVLFRRPEVRIIARNRVPELGQVSRSLLYDQHADQVRSIASSKGKSRKKNVAELVVDVMACGLAIDGHSWTLGAHGRSMKRTRQNIY
jgi:hypothetical protein